MACFFPGVFVRHTRCLSPSLSLFCPSLACFESVVCVFSAAVALGTQQVAFCTISLRLCAICRLERFVLRSRARAREKRGKNAAFHPEENNNPATRPFAAEVQIQIQKYD